MDRAGVVRRVAAVFGGVVVVGLGASGCNDPTGIRVYEFGNVPPGVAPVARPGGPNEPVETGQTVRAAQGGADSSSSGTSVRTLLR